MALCNRVGAYDVSKEYAAPIFTVYQTTRCHNQEDHTVCLHRYKTWNLT